MNAMYIVSFGNSKKYVVHIDSKSQALNDLRQEIKGYLERKFPEMKGLNYYDKMTIKFVPKDEEAQYAGYPEFNAESVPEIKQTLASEVEDEASVRRLNDNDPYGN